MKRLALSTLFFFFVAFNLVGAQTLAIMSTAPAEAAQEQALEEREERTHNAAPSRKAQSRAKKGQRAFTKSYSSGSAADETRTALASSFFRPPTLLAANFHLSQVVRI